MEGNANEDGERSKSAEKIILLSFVASSSGGSKQTLAAFFMLCKRKEMDVCVNLTYNFFCRDDELVIFFRGQFFITFIFRLHHNNANIIMKYKLGVFDWEE
jgi:hypothetical protein